MPFVITQDVTSSLDVNYIHRTRYFEQGLLNVIQVFYFSLTEGSWINTTDDTRFVICLHISAALLLCCKLIWVKCTKVFTPRRVLVLVVFFCCSWIIVICPTTASANTHSVLTLSHRRYQHKPIRLFSIASYRGLAVRYTKYHTTKSTVRTIINSWKKCCGWFLIDAPHHQLPLFSSLLVAQDQWITMGQFISNFEQSNNSTDSTWGSGDIALVLHVKVMEPADQIY